LSSFVFFCYWDAGKPACLKMLRQVGNGKSFFGMRHSDFAGFGSVFELVMGTHDMHQIPTIGFQ
jgi:hypothetical protein